MTFRYVSCFLLGVSFEGSCGFGNVVGRASYVGQRSHVDAVSHNLPDFRELVLVVGGENYHNLFI